MSKLFSASRHEDMPAFRYEELVRKFTDAGPDSHFVLWTKDPRRLLDGRLELARCSLQLTVTTLGGSAVEPGAPPWEVAIEAVGPLIARGLDPRLLTWRLDPWLPELADHGAAQQIATRLAGLGCTRCTMSFATWYQKVKERWPEGHARFSYSREQERSHALTLKKLVAPLHLYGCAQPHLAGVVTPASCIDGGQITRVTGMVFADGKDAYQRASCGCTPSHDIGRYRPCPHGCLYCYARTLDADDSQPSLFEA